MAFIKAQKIVYDDSGRIISGSASVVDAVYVPTGYCQDFCANLILDKPPGYQMPGQAAAVKVAVHLS